MNQIYPQVWISLPKEVRNHLVKVFGLTRSGVTEVVDQTVVSDGHSVEDLMGITLEKMVVYIGSEETFGRAWELTLAKTHSELHPPLGEIRGDGVVVPIPEAETAAPFCDTCDSKGVRHKKDCPKYVPINA